MTSTSNAFDPFGTVPAQDFVTFDNEQQHHDSFGSGQQGSFGSGSGPQSSFASTANSSSGRHQTSVEEEHQRSPSSRGQRNRSRSSSPSRHRHRSRSKSQTRAPASSSGRDSLSNKTTRKGKRPSSNKSKPSTSSSSTDKKKMDSTVTHRRSSLTSTSKHSSRRSSKDSDDRENPRTPRGRGKNKFSIGSPTQSDSSGSGSFACSTPTSNMKASATGAVSGKSTSSTVTRKSNSTTSSYSKMANQALSVWDMRHRFLQEFPNDSLPSDDVLRILYSPEKMEQLERMERFQSEHPGEAVPSDEVLKRLYTAPNVPPAGPAPRTVPTPPPPDPVPTQVVSTAAPQPARRGMMIRQDSGLTFATEGEWEQWQSSKHGFSDFGVDEFGNTISHNNKIKSNGMEGIVEGEEEEEIDSGRHVHTSIGKIPVINVRKSGNPSLDILKIGSQDTRSRKSSSQSLGSYNEKKTVVSDTAKSLSQSTHGRKSLGGDFSDFRKPEHFQDSASQQKFDPFDEEEEDLADESHDNFPSKPNSQIDLLEIPSEHLPGSKPGVDNTLELVNHLATSHGLDDDIFPVAGNSPFASIDSSGRAGKKGVKERTKGSKKKQSTERTTRKSCSSDSAENSKRTSRTVTREIGRNHSGGLEKMSHYGKKTKRKPVSRTKSASSAGPTFDFETPPTFGFGGPNAFHETTVDPSFSNKDKNTKEKNGEVITGSSNKDFFEVAALAWGDKQNTSVGQSTNLAPSTKEKRPRKASEERDYFPSSLPLGGNASGKVSSRHNHTAISKNHAMTGWLQEMPGFIAPVQHQEKESDDDSGFDLALPGSGGDISPLTAYTRKPVRPMIRGRR